MKRFFLYLAVVTVAVVAADRLLAVVYDALYRRTLIGQTGGKINRYLSLPETPKLVVMGNSRAFYQVIPDSFAVPTYSLCHAGMSQVFQTGLLSVMASAERLPPTILLHLDVPEYTAAQEQLTDIQNLKFYYRRDTTVTRLIRRISPYERHKYFFDTYRYNGRVINLLKNAAQSAITPTDQLGNGYEAIAASSVDSVATILSARRDVADSAARFHPERLRHLRQFLAMCRANHVRVIGFTSPLYARSPHELTACRALGRFLRAEGVPYIDYVNQPLASLQGRPTLWKDSHHLNELGARLQSQDLARRVNVLLAAPPVGVAPRLAGK